MKNFQFLIPAAAAFIALSPLTANAASAGFVSHAVISAASSTVAANSKGRPGEFPPAQVQQADAAYGFSTGPSANKDGAPIQNGD